MRWGAAAREKKPALTQRQEVIGPVWNGQASFGHQPGRKGAAVADMPDDQGKSRALRNLTSTTRYMPTARRVCSTWARWRWLCTTRILNASPRFMRNIGETGVAS